MSKKSGLMAAVLGFGLVMLTAAQGMSATVTSNIPGFAGRPLNNADASCFVPSGWSAVTLSSSCSGGKLLMIPAQFDYRTTGTTSFSAEAPIGPGGSCSFEPQCNAVVTNTNNGFINQTGSMNVCGITALGSFSVPTTGTLHFECNFGPGMTINSVSFTSPAP